MLFAIQKNTNNTWSITPTSGRFAGRLIATAEAIDLTSVEILADKAVGAIKAIWGLQAVDGQDVFSDVETVRALCLGKAFKGEVSRPVDWTPRGIYDMDTGRTLRRTRRLVMLGSKIFRRD